MQDFRQEIVQVKQYFLETRASHQPLGISQSCDRQWTYSGLLVSSLSVSSSKGGQGHWVWHPVRWALRALPKLLESHAKLWQTLRHKQLLNVLGHLEKYFWHSSVGSTVTLCWKWKNPKHTRLTSRLLPGGGVTSHLTGKYSATWSNSNYHKGNRGKGLQKTTKKLDNFMQKPPQF